MKTAFTRILGVALAIGGLVMALPCQATLVSYSLGAWSQQFAAPTTPPAGAPHIVDSWGYPGDTVTFDNGSGTINLANGASGTMNIGILWWGVDYTYGGTATSWAQADWQDLTFAINGSRSMTIGSGTGIVNQNGTLQSTWDDDYLSLSGGPMSSVLVQDVDLQWYRVDITPRSLPVASVNSFNGSIDPPAGGFAQTPRTMVADYTVTAVPEPTTVIAGVLLLIPFGASTIRMFRRR